MNRNESLLKKSIFASDNQKNLTYVSGIYSVFSKYLRWKCNCANKELQTVGNNLTHDVAEEERKIKIFLCWYWLNIKRKQWRRVEMDLKTITKCQANICHYGYQRT